MHRPYTNGEGIPVVACDIDGTLGEYHAWFLWFASLYFGRKMPNRYDINHGQPFWEFMGVKHKEYQDCKLAYRQSGLKRAMPCYRYSSAISKMVKEMGAQFWICTTRPYLRLDNIDPDTREWLRRNNIDYDAVLFGDDKYHELTRQVPVERIVAVVDDLPEMLDQAKEVGIEHRIIRDQPYNQEYADAWRVRTGGQLQMILRARIEKWHSEKG